MEGATPETYELAIHRVLLESDWLDQTLHSQVQLAMQPKLLPSLGTQEGHALKPLPAHDYGCSVWLA